jgi:hypothetical protein
MHPGAGSCSGTKAYTEPISKNKRSKHLCPQELSHEAAETVRQSQEISRQPIGSKQPYDKDGRYHTHADDWRGDALFILLSALHLCTRNILRRSRLHMLSIFPRPSKCGS